MTLLREAVTTMAFSIALIGAVNGVLAFDATYMSLVHLCVTFVLARLQHLIRHSHALRSSLTRSGNYIQYTSMDSEQKIVDASLNGSNNNGDSGVVSDNWPEHGEIVFDRVCAKYNDTAPDADGGDDTTLDSAFSSSLCNMSFSVKPGEHVGIVGRTGAGKSSIAMALFGLLRLESGTITIDNVDIRSVPLKTLRSRLLVVPQTPYILPGTVRDNVDPYSRYGTEEIRQALQAVGLTAESADIENDVPANWSTGQQKLLALSRALLQKPKILVLDEATASVDSLASQKLHMLIRRHFACCTVLTIAHRPDALIDCDLLLNVQDGFVSQLGKPESPFTTENSAETFGRLVARQFDASKKATAQSKQDARQENARFQVSGPPTPP
ncbi:hypothetical protein LPJ75_006338 [Coemansia sp. RSA 2598]|nr:hypothetical protein LPJ75_006338 [Coemansia sp. RSA 2598]